MRNISCNHLATIVSQNPMLFAAIWNKGRNSCAIANIFRNKVEFVDGDPILTLPLVNQTQVESFARTLSNNDVAHTAGNNQITVQISWGFKRGSAFAAGLSR